MASPLRLYLCLCISLTMTSLCAADTVTLENKCSFPVWPGIFSWNTRGYDVPEGFKPLLNASESYSMAFPHEWQGSIWGRFGCSFDSSERGSCLSGDCEGHLRCESAGPMEPNISTPVTQVSLDGGPNGGLYSIELEKGYNLPMSIKTCESQECTPPLADICPTNSQVKVNNEVVACKGECDSYLSKCTPPEFDAAFRKACPNVDPFGREVIYCPNPSNLTITFCPPQ
ncbi:hypothetical protein SUGI_0775750 [Cryptomeria japonica]|uniref:thaumatin-like protein n=1 Tax=Cryptomeria japonica TaxID=3369 RepID=UPI002414B925|nr:thaumatin-like protein [Cryptomeria japonica]GLJ38107.1 hypothetical protein SUGI_0775750 [Cryptomeria japonica]